MLGDSEEMEMYGSGSLVVHVWLMSKFLFTVILLFLFLSFVGIFIVLLFLYVLRGGRGGLILWCLVSHYSVATLFLVLRGCGLCLIDRW